MIDHVERWTCDKCLVKTEIKPNGMINRTPPDWVRVWVGEPQLESRVLAHLCHICQNALKSWLMTDGSPDP